MEKYLCVGKIVKPVGIKGDAKVLPYTDNIKRFNDLKYFYYENSTEKHSVERVSIRNDFVVLKIENINSPEQVDALREKLIFVDRENAVKLEEDGYFIADLVGCEIFDGEKSLGKIVDVENYGASDILVIKNGNQNYSVPFLKEIFEKIDVKNQKIDVKKHFFEVIVWKLIF